jgi:hypothetical protein
MAESPERYCSTCGQELRPEDLFCSNCSKPVHLTAHAPTPEADVPVPPPQQAQRTAPLPHPAGASSTQSGQAPFSIKEMVVLGVGAGVFTLLTTTGLENLLGKLFVAILAPMMGSVIASIIKVYLSGAAVGGRRLGILGILTALWRFGALPAETRNSLLLAGLRSSAGVVLVSSTISVSAVGGGVAIGKNLPIPNGDGGGEKTSVSSIPSGPGGEPTPVPSTAPSSASPQQPFSSSGRA